MDKENGQTNVDLDGGNNHPIGRASGPVTECRKMKQLIGREKSVTAYGVFKKCYMANIHSGLGHEGRKRAFATLGNTWTALSQDEKDYYHMQAQALNDGASGGRKSSGCPSSHGKKGQVVYYSRCVPQQVMRAVKEMEGKFEALRLIRDMGFESLCRVSCGNMPKKFIMKLLGHFDPMTCKLVVRGERAKISAQDVVDVMGVPGGQDPVPVDSSSVPKLLQVYEKNRWGKAKKPNFNALRLMLQTSEDEDMTKQAFLLLALGSVLCPTSSNTLSAKLYSAIVDVSDTRRYNWGDFVLNWLCEEVRRFKLGERGRSSSRSGPKKSSVGGCMLFLLLFYFERFPFRNFESRPMNVHPLEFWDTMRVRRRVCIEQEYATVYPKEAIGLDHGLFEGLDSPDMHWIAGEADQSSRHLQSMALNLMAKHVTYFREEFDRNAFALVEGHNNIESSSPNELEEGDSSLEGDSSRKCARHK